MRLFIALELAPAIITALERIQQQMRRSGRHPVKWVKPEAVHLTLQFLGEVPDAQVPAICDALAQVAAAQQSGTRLHLAQAGAFPNLQRPQTIWVGVAGSTAPLVRLQQTVMSAMEPLGFAPETRPFRAHLTLGRVRRDADRAQLAAVGSAIRALPAPQPVSWEMGRPALFQSTLTPDGAHYTRLSPET